MADVLKCKVCYPFGMTMPGRNANPTTYRHGFNGMEKDDELKGNGNSYDFGARMYDPRIGRWLTLDPLASKYPDLSDYSYAANSPIFIMDEGGTHLKDANGNIIYTNIRGSGDLSKNGETYTMDVYVYANDGTKIRARLTVAVQSEISQESKNLLYFCHGYSQMEGKISPYSGSEIEGLLIGDREGKLDEFGLEKAKEGDIAIFRVTQKIIDAENSLYSQDELGQIFHTAIMNADGTLSSKDGTANDLNESANLEQLVEKYGDVSFVAPVENKKLESLNGESLEGGVAEYSEEEVKQALTEK